MMKIRFEVMWEADDPEWHNLEMPAVPRYGEYVDVGDGVEHHVRAVLWEPLEPEYDAYVRLDP